MMRSTDSSKGDTGGVVPLILLAGPTASGKTSLSIELAARISAEIINADSMQVYRRMEIGTAKPTIEERRIVPHHLIDIVDPDESFDAAKYLQAAFPVIEDIRKRGKLPLVVGGTGLYMRVLTGGLCRGPSPDPEVKRKLIAEEKSRGLRHLYDDLARVDLESAQKIHPNDRQRIMRALEVFHTGGVPLSAIQKGHGFRQQIFTAIRVFINRDREVLYDRINRRVDRMVDAGLKNEVEGLLAMGYSAELKSMQSIGYRQMCAHLAGAISLDEAVFQIKRDTRRYAKRQITWFGGESGFGFFDAEDVEGINQYLQNGLRN